MNPEQELLVTLNNMMRSKAFNTIGRRDKVFSMPADVRDYLCEKGSGRTKGAVTWNSGRLGYRQKRVSGRRG